MKRTTMLLGAVVLFLCSMFSFVPSEALGAVPRLINFQGVVKDAAGNPPAADMLDLTFTIYDDPLGGSALWTETHPVVITDGLFSVLLGSSNPIPDSVFEDTVRYLGIKVATDPELLPRQRLASVGFAYRVGTIDGATGGVISGDVSIQSNLAVDGAMNAKNMVLSGPGPINTPLTIHASPLQTSPLMEIKNSSGTTLVSCASDGIIATPAIQLTSFSPTISNFPAPVPIEIKTSKGSIYIGRDDGILQQISLDPAASVSKLTEWKNGAGASVASIEPSGATTIEHELGHNLGLCHTGPVGGGFNFVKCTDATGNPVASIDLAGNINSDGMITANAGLTVGSGGPILQATGGAGGSGQLGAGGGGGGGVIKVMSPADGGHVLLEPGSGGNVGIGTAAPNSPLQVNGAIATAVTFVPGCANTTLDGSNSVVLVSAAFGECFLNLPTAVGIQGRQYTIKAVNPFSGTYNITPFGGQTIDGNASYILTAVNKYVTIISDGASWQIIGNN